MDEGAWGGSGYLMMTLTRIQAVERLTRGIPNHRRVDTWVGPGMKGPYLFSLFFIIFL